VHRRPDGAVRLQHRAALMRAVFVVYLLLIVGGLAVLLLLALRHS
jgi:hypothetical protein